MIDVTLPLKIGSPLNGSHGHWAKGHRERKLQRHAVGIALKARYALRVVGLPCVVTITRIAPRELDSDNLAAGCKGVRDGAADALGVNDRDIAVEWKYAQRRGRPREYGVHVRVEPRT